MTPLQEEMAAVIAALEEVKDFALAEGTALTMREQIERGTRDLELLPSQCCAGRPSRAAAEQALRRAEAS